MAKTNKILVINPGSTSTKIAIYEDETELLRKTIQHSVGEIAKYKVATDQAPFRLELVKKFLEEVQIKPADLNAIAARGGALPPIKGGAYRINNIMVNFLKTRPRADHASNIAALIAYELAEEVGIPAYIYDAISVNELSELAQISGLPHIRRCGISHVLNQRAMTRKYAQTQNRDYADLTLIIAHLGGGITMSVHHQGKIIDVLFDDEGPFTPERAGKLPCAPLIEMCYSEQCDYQTALKLLRGQGGLVAYLGTNNTLEVEKRIAQGDQQALLIYQAMAYQIAKGIGELATVVNGQVDAIILTGGIAHSQLLTGWIADRVKFIAKVVVMPGENELEALALGVLRVLRGEEEAHEFQIEETDLNS